MRDGTTPLHAEIDELSGVVRVPAPHDDDGLYLLEQPLKRSLMFLGRQADCVDVADLGRGVSRGDCQANPGGLAFGYRRLAENAEFRPGIIPHVKLGLDDIHARQVADDSLDLDMRLRGR